VLSAVNRDEHAQIACALLTKRDKGLVFGRGVPSVESVHVWKFYDYDRFWFPVTPFRQFVGSGFRQEATTVLGNHRAYLCPILIEFGWVSDDVFHD
jgi:hypothetical protein